MRAGATGRPACRNASSGREALSMRRCRAWRAGAVVVKLFPAGSVGPGYIKDLLGPLRDVPLLPTGGVTLENAASFLQAGAWGLGMGSALVSPTMVSEGRFDELQDRARRLTQTLADSRPMTTTAR